MGWECWLGTCSAWEQDPSGLLSLPHGKAHTAVSECPCRHVWESTCVSQELLGSSALRRDREPIARSHQNLAQRKDAIPIGNGLS